MSERTLKDVFREHDVEIAKMDADAKAEAASHHETLTKWAYFHTGPLEEHFLEFRSLTAERGGEASIMANNNRYGLELARLSDRSLDGLTLWFSVNPKQDSFTAAIYWEGKELKFENIDPTQATPEWIVRWLEFLTAEFRKRAH